MRFKGSAGPAMRERRSPVGFNDMDLRGITWTPQTWNAHFFTTPGPLFPLFLSDLLCLLFVIWVAGLGCQHNLEFAVAKRKTHVSVYGIINICIQLCIYVYSSVYMYTAFYICIELGVYIYIIYTLCILWYMYIHKYVYHTLYDIYICANVCTCSYTCLMTCLPSCHQLAPCFPIEPTPGLVRIEQIPVSNIC